MTETEINEILTQYKAARTAVLVGGQSYTINSGGSSRQVTLADLSLIEKQIQIYTQMLGELNGEVGFVTRPGW